MRYERPLAEMIEIELLDMIRTSLTNGGEWNESNPGGNKTPVDDENYWN